MSKTLYDYCACCGKRIEVGDWCIETYVSTGTCSEPVTFCKSCVVVTEHAGRGINVDMRGEQDETD